MLNQQIRDLVLLEMRPQIFDGVEFGSIGRQFFEPEAARAFDQHRFDGLAAVDGRSVPNDQELAGQVAQKRFQELGRARAIDTAFVNSEIKLPERQAGNEREFVPVERLAQHRGLPARSPRAHPVRPGAQSALVDEDDGAAFPPGFFLRRGHVTRFQSAIAASLRSMARRVGCWQLNPKPRKTRQT